MQHNEKVRKLVKAQQRDFLEFNPKSGWGQLCKFLDKEVPIGEYPNLFEGDQVRGMVRSMVRETDEVVQKRLIAIFVSASLVGTAMMAWWLR